MGPLALAQSVLHLTCQAVASSRCPGPNEILFPQGLSSHEEGGCGWKPSAEDSKLAGTQGCVPEWDRGEEDAASSIPA